MNKIVLTNAGIAELINAEQTGTAPVVLTQVGLGTGKYNAAATRTSLQAEIKRVSALSGGAVGDNVIHLFMTDASSDAYTAYEVGIYTSSGTLFGVVSSQTEPIVEKASGSTALLAIDFVLTNADPASITVGDTNFVLPPATTEMQGIVELATPAEVIAGTDNYRAITPYALAQRTATAVRKGLMRFATVAESETGTNTDSAVTPAGLMAVAAKYLPLAGGAMAGQIKSNISDILARNVDGGWLRINGSTTDANGANLTLWGKSATEAGQFRLMARNTASYSLVGTSAGVLTWSGPVVTASDDSTKIATTAYVKDCLPKSVGSATKLTYTNSKGVLTASTSTVGSASKPVYLNDGTLTACSSSLTDYLPLDGGTMTGAIKRSGVFVQNTVNNDQLNICGGTDTTHGARIDLFGEAHTQYPSQFFIHCRSVTNGWTISLNGKPDGTLTWGSNSILHAGNYGSYALPLSGGTLTGSVNFGANGNNFYAYANQINIDSAQSSQKEDWRFRGQKNSNQTTNTGELYQIGAYQLVNSQNYIAGIRVGNPRNGNIPAAATGVHNGNEWGTIGVKFWYANNYAYGWVSNTPPLSTSSPTYDANHVATVGNLKTALGDYLPLAGGTMTGVIYTSRADILYRNVDNSELNINGGSGTTKGARLVLNGKDNSSNPSAFVLQARNDSTTYSLQGKINGELSWGGTAYITGSITSKGILNVGATGSGEGGEIHLQAADSATTQAGIVIDQRDSKLRIFGIASSDGTSKTGSGTILTYDPYAKTLGGKINLDSDLVSASRLEFYNVSGTASNGGIIDFHFNGSTDDYTSRIIEDQTGRVSVFGTLYARNEIISGAVNAISCNSSNGERRFNGGTSLNDGASFIAYGKDNTTFTGSFRIRAHDGTNQKDLVGTAAGGLTWNGSNIYVANKNNISTVGNAITRSGTSNWLRFTGGETDYTDGASLILYGKEHSSSAGVSSIRAYDGTNSSSLTIYPDRESLFSRGLIVSSNIAIRNGNLTRGTAPSADQNHNLIYQDKNGNAISRLMFQYTTGKRHGVYLEACNDSGSYNGILGIYMDADGTTAYTRAPTPSTGDNTTKIATTAFVRGQVPASKGGGTKLLSTNANGVLGESSSTVGSATQPVYLNSGTVTACTESSMLNPPGTVIAYAGTSAPSGWLYCNGAAVSRTTYAALFSAIGTGYGTGNGSSTFNLPDFRNRVPQGGSSATDRGNIAAGLPNITGKSHAGKGGSGFDYETEGGAFRLESSASSNSGEGNKWQGSIENFDASRCSSIYGNSTTVQPPAVKVMFIIKT